MKETTKLYKIILQRNQEFYVLALDPTSAYEKLRQHLDDKDLYFISEREMKEIELIAEDYNYPNCGTRLLL